MFYVCYDLVSHRNGMDDFLFQDASQVHICLWSFYPKSFSFKSILQKDFVFINICTYFSIVGTVSGFFPLAILGVCLAGTSAILDQKTADISKSKDLQGVNKKLTSMKDAVDAATAGISKLDVGLTL